MSTKEEVLRFLQGEEASTRIQVSGNHELAMSRVEYGNFDLIYGYRVYGPSCLLKNTADLLCVYHRPTGDIYQMHYTLGQEWGQREGWWPSFDEVKQELVKQICTRIDEFINNEEYVLEEETPQTRQMIENHLLSCKEDLRTKAIKHFLAGGEEAEIRYATSDYTIYDMLDEVHIFSYIDNSLTIPAIIKQHIIKKADDIRVGVYEKETLRRIFREVAANPDPLMIQAMEMEKAVQGKKMVMVTFENKTTKATVKESIPAKVFAINQPYCEYDEINRWEMTDRVRRKVLDEIYYGSYNGVRISIRDVTKIEYRGKAIWPIAS